MSRALKVVVGLVVIAALAVGGFFGFEYFDHRDKVKAAKQPCGDLTTPMAGASVPSGLPFTLPAGQTLLRVDRQGSSTALTVSLDGERKDLVRLRDQAVADFKAQGYSAHATDQEPTYEAEGAFSGKAEGSINVQPLCEQHDKIRYLFTS